MELKGIDLKRFDLKRFERLPLLGIVRGVDVRHIEELVESVSACGLESLEITMNTANAPELIARAAKCAGDRLMLGAGTVLSRSDLDHALDAGARYIVMPTLVEEVAAECRERAIPFFPGALTPQEIHDAWRAGASMVKVFPARIFGPEYFREIKGPFDKIRLLACGGISAANIGAYAACGADAFAFGGSIFNNQWIDDGRFDLVEAALRELISAFEEARLQLGIAPADAT
jgi:2-dehydro-3-deoxyphosphogluconate aldolase/(4S)-4-hydroxy-2-oxoglutarate aldolase